MWIELHFFPMWMTHCSSSIYWKSPFAHPIPSAAGLGENRPHSGVGIYFWTPSRRPGPAWRQLRPWWPRHWRQRGNQKMWVLQHRLLQNCVGCPKFLALLCKLSNALVDVCRNMSMRFGKGGESRDGLGGFNILTILSLPICDYNWSLHLFWSFF